MDIRYINKNGNVKIHKYLLLIQKQFGNPKALKVADNFF